MKLETSDLVGFIKERQRLQMRALRQQPPLLVIVIVGDEAASASYVRAKQRYGADIGVQVHLERVKTEADLRQLLNQPSQNEPVTGLVLQLPLPKDFDTDAVIKLITPSKDIDGLGQSSRFEPATAKAIMWILASLSLNLKEITACVVGQGRLVGAPVAAMLESSGAKVKRCDINTRDLETQTSQADIVVSGVGKPGLIKREMLKAGAILIDAGTAETGSKITGDADPALYDDPDIRVTPVPGGVGPMTVAALFDNLLIAAQS